MAAVAAVPPTAGAAGGGRGRVPAGKWTQQVYGWIRDGKHHEVVVALQPVLEVRPPQLAALLPPPLRTLGRTGADAVSAPRPPDPPPRGCAMRDASSRANPTAGPRSRCWASAFSTWASSRQRRACTNGLCGSFPGIRTTS